MQGLTLCEGDSAEVQTFSWPSRARCEAGQVFLDNAYAGISFNERRQGTFVISQPNVYKLGQNSLDDVSDEYFK